MDPVGAVQRFNQAINDRDLDALGAVVTPCATSAELDGPAFWSVEVDAGLVRERHVLDDTPGSGVRSAPTEPTRYARRADTRPRRETASIVTARRSTAPVTM